MTEAPNIVPNSFAKCGWLMKQSSILHRWKKGWFILFKSGRMMYYEDQNSGRAEEFIDVPSEQAVVFAPEQCLDISPPEGHASDVVFSIRGSKTTWNLCAHDADEMMAWKLQLEEARNIRPRQSSSPVGMHAFYPAQYPANYYGGYGCYPRSQYTIQAPPGSTVFITENGPVIVDQHGNQVAYVNGNHYGRGRGLRDAGVGVAAGAALGTLFLWPMAMWPLWCW